MMFVIIEHLYYHTWGETIQFLFFIIERNIYDVKERVTKNISWDYCDMTLYPSSVSYITQLDKGKQY